VIHTSKYVALAALASTLVACGADFDPSSRVTSPRILAVQADAPYAAPGQEVKLSALGVDPAGRPMTWAWSICVNPAASTPIGCFAEIAMGKTTTFATGVDLKTFSFRVPGDALSSLPEAARSAATIGVAVVACPGTLTLGQGTVPVECIVDGRALRLDEFDLGMKRVFVREKDKNANPAFAQVTWDGAPWPEGEVKEIASCNDDGTNRYDDCSGEKHQIAATATPESAETGVDEHGRSFHEDVIVQYDATEGIFEFPARRSDSPSTGFVARKAGTITVWMLLRDDRGGVSWTTRTIRAR
jgi:hypothetical protein